MADDQLIYCPMCRDIHAEGKHLQLDDVRKRHINNVYEATGKNKVQTAKILGIHLRTVRKLFNG